MSALTAERTVNRWFAASAAVGLLHAAPSLYWALGGSALISTVGEWAVTWRRESPTQVAVVLLTVVVVKVGGALLPLMNHRGLLPWPRAWRGLSWFGAGLLIAYGGLNTVAAWLALAGLGAADQETMALIGHGFLWDPLFLIWGALLFWALRRSRPGTRAPLVR